METAILLLSSFLSTLGCQSFSKLSSTNIENSKAGYALFLIVNSVVACVFFLILAGFRLYLTFNTALFSLGYAAVAFISIISNLKALRLTEISNVYVSSNACNLIAVSAMGFLVFGEEISVLKIIRIVIMLTAVFFVFIGMRNKNSNCSGFSVVLIVIVIAQISNYLVLKLYALAPNTTDDNSFFFFTNIALILGTAVWFLKEQLTNPISIAQSKCIINPRVIVPFVLNTVCSNINSLVSLKLISRIEASLYTTVTTAICILCGVIASLIFRERNKVYAYIAAILAIIAVVI